MPYPYNPTKLDGRTVAAENELRVLLNIRHFGHLRRQEIAAATWPKSTGKSAYVMAARTIKRMVETGLILERPNSLGGFSLVLASKGVARLREMDVNAQAGYDLAFNGPQFFHRTLGTNYLIERARAGNEIFGEYALLKSWSPLDKEYVKDTFKKIPDGLILYPGDRVGLSDNSRIADWIEVESAFKSYDEVKKALELFKRQSTLTKDEKVSLNKLVFVYDSRQRHDRVLLRYMQRFLKENPSLSPEHVLSEIILARCFIDIPFTWHGVEERSALDLMRDAGDLGTDEDETAFDTNPQYND